MTAELVHVLSVIHPISESLTNLYCNGTLLEHPMTAELVHVPSVFHPISESLINLYCNGTL